MGQADALGFVAGAAGVEDGGQVFAVGLIDGRAKGGVFDHLGQIVRVLVIPLRFSVRAGVCFRCGGDAPTRHQFLVGAGREDIGDVGQQDLAHAALGAHGGRHPSELRQCDQDLGPGGAGDMGHLVGVGVGVGEDDHAAGAQGAVVGDDELRHIRQHHHHPAARSQPQPVQDMGELVGLALELLIGDLGAEEDGGRPAGQPIGGAFQEFVERLAGDGHGAGGLGMVGAQPRPTLQQIRFGYGSGLASPRPALGVGLDEAFDGAVDGLVAFELHFVFGCAHIHHLGPRHGAAHLFVDATREVVVALAGDDEGGDADLLQQWPAVPAHEVVGHHAFEGDDFGVPAGAILPPQPEEGGRQAVDEREDAGEGVFAGGGDEDEPLQLFGVGDGVFGADRAAERMPHQHEFLRQLELFADAVQVGHQFGHGVLRGGSVALAVAAQVGRDHAVAVGEVVDLVLPGVGAAQIAVDEQDRAIDAVRPDVDDTEFVADDARDRGFDPVEVVVEGDGAALETTQFVLHGGCSFMGVWSHVGVLAPLPRTLAANATTNQIAGQTNAQ